jgi:hypothetical protein
MSIIYQTSLSVLDGGCAQGALGRAGFVRFHRSTNLRTATALLFSSYEVVAPSKELNHD